ncbi:hypothetical protein HY251_09020 [bacterium]|nr:hypothetical protein [bacterium]
MGRGLLFVGRELLFAGRELLFAGRELLFMGRELLFAGRELLFVGRELLFVGRELLFVGRELLFVRTQRLALYVVDVPPEVAGFFVDFRRFGLPPGKLSLANWARIVFSPRKTREATRRIFAVSCRWDCGSSRLQGLTRRNGKTELSTEVVPGAQGARRSNAARYAG